jgi:predicted dehydrogenase
MSEPFRIAVVGTGSMGRNHAKAYLQDPTVALVAGCDVVPAQREAWGAACNVAPSALYADYEEMYEREQLDAVIISTHASVHAAPTIAAAQRGIHVFCEKPVAPSLREADEMVAACDAAGVKLAINHIKRGSNGNAAAKRLIAEGAIGQPYYIRGEAKGGRWAGSELMEMGTHVFDWLLLLAGDATSLYADLLHEDRPAGKGDIVHSLELPYKERDCGLVLGQRAYCSIRFASGLHADVGYLMQPTSPDDGCGFDIVGTKGTLSLRRGVETVIHLQEGDHRGPATGAAWEPIEVDELAGLDPPVAEPDRKSAIRLACQRRMLQDLRDAIREDRDPLASGRAGVAALELIMATWESARVGGPVAIPLLERDHPLELWLQERATEKGDRVPVLSGRMG